MQIGRGKSQQIFSIRLNVAAQFISTAAFFLFCVSTAFFCRILVSVFYNWPMRTMLVWTLSIETGKCDARDSSISENFQMFILGTVSCTIRRSVKRKGSENTRGKCHLNHFQELRSILTWDGRNLENQSREPWSSPGQQVYNYKPQHCSIPHFVCAADKFFRKDYFSPFWSKLSSEI